MKVTPFETYQSYLSMKSHFTNRKYDFFRYGGKSRATMASFNKRKDKYWFEKTSRKYSDEQIVDFLLANFVTTDNPKNLWIGEIINSGERTYADWMRRKQSISYLFKEESGKLLGLSVVTKFASKKLTISSSEYFLDVFSNQYLSFLLLKDAIVARDLPPYRKKSYLRLVK